MTPRKTVAQKAADLAAMYDAKPMTNAADVEYHEYLTKIQKRLSLVTGQLFTTDVDKLYDSFLAALPKDEEQYHNCSCCRHFVNTYGKLVTINDDGTLQSALWSDEDAPELYQGSVRAMLRQIKKAKVTGPYYDAERMWGTYANVTDDNRTWCHLSAAPTTAMIHIDRAQTAGQKRAAKREEYGIVCRALAEFPLAVMEKVVNFLQSETLYRSERFIGPAKWLLDLQTMRKNMNTSKVRDQLTWKAVADAPAGYCHPKTTAIGTLLDDVAAGLPFEEVKRKFAAITNSTVYRRSTVAPSAGTIKTAEKLFETMGLAPALARRYATFDEIPGEAFVWEPITNPQSAAALGKPELFGHLKTKGTTPVTPTTDAPKVTMTWEKFQRTVLPTARSIEVQVPASADRFMALVTAVDESAPPILQWDNAGDRNPFSWYYASGVDAEMNRRLVAAGARTKDNDIRFSGMWDNYNDLDIHAYGPGGYHIWYHDLKPRGQHGWLDVDMNAGGARSMQPVENIRWEKNTAPNGHYRFEMNMYAPHGYPARTPFRAEIEVGGQVFSFSSEVTHQGHSVTVAEFDYVRGQPVIMRGSSDVRVNYTTPSANVWNVTPGTYVPVTAVVKSPNLWGSAPQEHHGKHAFFLLKDCKDAQQGVGRGFFTESLKSDLHQVRSVLEAYAASATIEGEGSACGVGISSSSTGNLVVRVTGATGQTLYQLDRWD